MIDPITLMAMLRGLSTVAGAATGSAQAAPPPPPPEVKGPPGATFADQFSALRSSQTPALEGTAKIAEAIVPPVPRPPIPPRMDLNQSAGMSFTPATDPIAQAAATLTSAGAQPPVTSPVASKPPTALPDQGGSPMLPTGVDSGAMGSYYNDVPDPTQPLTAAGVQTPTQKAVSGLASGLQDLQMPQAPEVRPPPPPSVQGPLGGGNMDALIQMVLNSAKRPEQDPRRGLAMMLMGGR